MLMLEKIVQDAEKTLKARKTAILYFLYCPSREQSPTSPENQMPITVSLGKALKNRCFEERETPALEKFGIFFPK